MRAAVAARVDPAQNVWDYSIAVALLQVQPHSFHSGAVRAKRGRNLAAFAGTANVNAPGLSPGRAPAAAQSKRQGGRESIGIQTSRSAGRTHRAPASA